MQQSVAIVQSRQYQTARQCDCEFRRQSLGKTKNKNRLDQKERSRQKSVKAVREEEVELRGIGFVKQVDFKSGAKERGSYG